MSFSRPSLTEIVNRRISDLNSKVDDSATFLRRSVFIILSKMCAGGDHNLYGFLQDAKNQLFISSADDEFLALHGNEFSKPRKTGDKATGSGTVTGTNGEVIEAGTSIQSATGNIYTIDSDVTISGGVATVNFTANEVGDDYNEDGGTELTFISPLPNVNTTIIVDSNGITDGIDQETIEQYRSRLLLRKRQPPHGGTKNDYENWALEVSGVTRAWYIEQYMGMGTGGLAFARDNDEGTIIPNATQRDEVYNYILEHTNPVTQLTEGIPVTAKTGFFMIPCTAKTVNFNISIYPNTATVQASIQTRIRDLFKSAGGAGQTISLSEMYEAIASAIGEVRSKINSPEDDVAAATNQIHVPGDFTFEDYS